MFEVYLTTTGPSLITNEQQIQIMDAVSDGSKTFSEIQKVTSIPKSTLSTQLKKLMSEKYLSVKTVEVCSCMETVYVPVAFPIVKAIERDIPEIWSTFTVDLDYECYDSLERWILWFVDVSTGKCGLSLRPLVSNMFSDIGRMGAVVNRDKSYEEAFANLQLISKYLLDTKLKQISQIPLVFETEFVLDKYAFSCQAYNYSYFIASCICGYFSKFQNIPCVIKKIEEIPGKENCTRIHLGYGNREDHFDFRDGMGCDFTIYWDGEEYVPVQGDLDNEILANLGMKRMSSLGMSEIFNVPASTMSGYMTRLERMGLIKSTKVHNRVEYALSAKKIFDWKKIVPSLASEGNSYLVKAWSEPVHSMRYFFCYFLTYTKMVGFDTDTFMHSVGKVIAHFFTKAYPTKTTEDLLRDITSNSHNLLSADFAITSLYPLSVVKVSDYSMSMNVAQDMRTLFNSMITGMLEKSMGVPFRIREDSLYGEGNRGYRATFVPNPD